MPGSYKENSIILVLRPWPWAAGACTGVSMLYAAYTRLCFLHLCSIASPAAEPISSVILAAISCVCKMEGRHLLGMLRSGFTMSTFNPKARLRSRAAPFSYLSNKAHVKMKNQHRSIKAVLVCDGGIDFTWLSLGKVQYQKIYSS